MNEHDSREHTSSSTASEESPATTGLSSLTPPRGLNRSSSSLILPAYSDHKGWWATLAGIVIVALIGALALFAWYWFIGYVKTVAGSGKPGYKDGPAHQSKMYNPKGLAISAKQVMYIADTGNHIIRKMDAKGILSTVAGTGQSGWRDGHASQALFNSPTGLVLRKDGVVFVADTGNHRIRRIDPDGTVRTLAGTGTAGILDGPTSRAQLNAPQGLAWSAKEGRLYIADTGNHRIRFWTSKEGIQTLAGQKKGRKDGLKTQASFHSPKALCMLQNGTLLVADSQNHQIRAIAPTGYVSTRAGSGSPGNRNGAVHIASFNNPSGIAQTPDGSIYVADEYSHQIRRIEGRYVTTLAGSGDAGAHDGAPTRATFSWPTQVVSGPQGNLFVADWGNDMIRRVTLHLLRP